MIRAAEERRPVSPASASLRSRRGKIPASRYASATGVGDDPPREATGHKPAARTISIGTAGHERTTVPAPCLESATGITNASNAAVSTAMGEVVMISDDSVGSQLFDCCMVVSQPVAVNE